MNPFESYTNPFDSTHFNAGGSFQSAPTNNQKSQINKFVKEEEDPIFLVTAVKFMPPAPICSLLTRNENLIVGLKNGHLIWFNLRDSKERDGIFLSLLIPFKIIFSYGLDIEISNKEITKMFLDPTANHLLVCVGEETYYVHRTAKKPKFLAKWKGVHTQS